MNRVSVVRQPLVVLLALVCVCSFTFTDKVWAEDTKAEAKKPEVNIQKADKDTPPPNPECKARLQVADPVYEFGSVHSADAKSISHTFVLRNTGEETLLINKVKPSCGCTSAVASATQIAPGATATVTAKLNPKGKSGNQTITVRVSTNDPTNASQMLRMSGTILSSWRVIPLMLDMGHLGKLESATKNVTVTSQYMENEPQFKITALKVGSPEIKAVTTVNPDPQSPSPKKSFIEVSRTVRVSVTAGSTEGLQTQRLYIATDDPKNPTHTVTVRWTVEGDLSCNMEKVVVNDLKGNKTPKELTILSHKGTPFEVTSIEIKGEAGVQDVEVTLKPESTQVKKIYTISPKNPDGSAKGSRSGSIIFHTTHPEKPDLTVPYKANFGK